MKRPHRPTTVWAVLLAVWFLFVPLGGGVSQAAAVEQLVTYSVSESPDTSQVDTDGTGSVTLPAHVTTYVGAAVVVSPSYHGYGTIRNLSVEHSKLASVKLVSGSRNFQIIGKKAGNTSVTVTFSNGSRKSMTVKVAKGSAKLPKATAKLYPGKTVTIRPQYNGVVSIRKVSVAKGKIASVKLVSGSKQFQIRAKALGKTKVTVTFTNGTVRSMTLTVYEKPKANSLSVKWLEDSYRKSNGQYTVRLRVKNQCDFKITTATIRVNVQLTNGKKRQLEQKFSLNLKSGKTKEVTVKGTLPAAPKQGKAGCVGFQFDFT